MRLPMTSRCAMLGMAFCLLAAAAAAVEIPLRDGSVIEADSYTANGSYVIAVLPSGAQVAYDLADVDMEALRAGEQAAASETAPVAQPSLQDLAANRDLAVDVPEDRGAGLRISDHDVGHVRADGSPLPSDDEAADEDQGGVPDGHEKGGQVALKGFQLAPAGTGRWRVEGQVVNLLPNAVESIQVRITASPATGDPIIATVPVANRLGPDEVGSFEHIFAVPAADGDTQPPVRFEVFWMQTGETVRRDDRIPRPNAVPPVPGQRQKVVPSNDIDV